MRTDAAVPRGVAHHDVVEPRLRNEREAPQQRVGRGHVQVDAAHQQRRMVFRQLGARERAVPSLPPLATAFHDPGFDIVARGERGERAPVDHAGKTGQCLRHKKRALLPIAAQERPRRKSAE
jgi:hypothetical protein